MKKSNAIQCVIALLVVVCMCLSMCACRDDDIELSSMQSESTTIGGDITDTDTADSSSNTIDGTSSGDTSDDSSDSDSKPDISTPSSGNNDNDDNDDNDLPSETVDNSVKNVFDGNPNTVWIAESRDKTVLEHSFGKMTNFNAIHFNESGNKIDNVVVEIKGSDGKYTTIYQQDEVGERTGILDKTVSASNVRITLEYGQKPVIRDITFENITVKRNEPFRVVAYYTKNDEGNRNNFDKLDVMTDLIINGYTSFNAAGDLVWDTKEKMESVLQELKTAIGSRDIDLWFCIGSYSAGTDTSKLFVDAAARKKLINTCVEITKKYGFVGIDVDYEYPYEQSNWDNYSVFLVELKAALKKEGKMLSTAQGPWGVGLSDEAINAIDYVNIMAYDLDDDKGRHSGYELVQSSTEYFVNLGFPKSKLVMGLAFYGHSTTNKSDPMSGQPYYYYVQRFRNALKTYTNELGGYYFTGRDMNRDKTYYCIEEGLSGVFAWHFACDIEYTDERSLWRAVGETVDRFVK